MCGQTQAVNPTGSRSFDNAGGVATGTTFTGNVMTAADKGGRLRRAADRLY